MMMMMTTKRSPRAITAAALPPELYFRLALLILTTTRALVRAGVLRSRSPYLALVCSNRLSRAGMKSWRARVRRRRERSIGR